MENFTIDCDRKSIIIGNGEYRDTFTIICDGKEDNNSFEMEYYGDGIVVERNRCELSVYIKPNKTPFNKTFMIVCKHMNDSDVYVQINIEQEKDIYDMAIISGADYDSNENIYTKELKSIVTIPQHEKNDFTTNMNYNFYETCNLRLYVSGGSKKYRIESILRCHKNGNKITYKPFDNGFVYNKFEDNLQIVSYGRPFLEDDYYLITLCHEDYRETKTKIKITYLRN